MMTPKPPYRYQGILDELVQLSDAGAFIGDDIAEAITTLEDELAVSKHNEHCAGIELGDLRQSVDELRDELTAQQEAAKSLLEHRNRLISELTAKEARIVELEAELKAYREAPVVGYLDGSMLLYKPICATASPLIVKPEGKG